MRPPALGAFERKRLRLRSGEKPRVLDPRQLIGDMPCRVRRRVVTGEADKVARRGVTEETGRAPGQAGKLVGAEVGVGASGNKLHCEYLDAGGGSCPDWWCSKGASRSRSAPPMAP